MSDVYAENFTAVQLHELEQRCEQVGMYLHIDELRAHVDKLTVQAGETTFWNDAARATEVMAQLGALKEKLNQYDSAHKLLLDSQAAFELADTSSQDDEMLIEAKRLASKLTDVLDNLELNTWFNDEFDTGAAIVTITPGQGGLEAQDWCDMLFKMYLHYCERKSWSVDINDAPVGEVIGIDRATFTVTGKNAYGMLRAEQGVHRLVRISPTDAKKRRQTTFAGVEVLPVLPQTIEVQIDTQDIRIDVYHASGPGGQGVNTTDSAVRITHIPTGIVVTCQNERSQLQNKAAAMQILRSKLYELEKQRREEELDDLRGPKHDISWGNQIRNYILYPFQLVKDTRTQVETGNVDAVLQEGDLDQFIIAYHRWASERRG